MAARSRTQRRCLLAIPSLPWRDQLREAIEKAFLAESYEVIYVADLDQQGRLDDVQLFDLDRLDLIIADVSASSDRIAAAVGFAIAKGCRVLPIVRASMPRPGPAVFDDPPIQYTPGLKGLAELVRKLRSSVHVRDKEGSRRDAFDQQRIFSTFAVDLDKLNPRDKENLVRELLMQLGFERIDWHKDRGEIDLTAELTRKDPDGSSFHELWLISLGRNAPPEMLADMIRHDFEFLYQRFLHGSPKLRTRARTIGRDTSVTVLLISLDQHSPMRFDDLVSDDNLKHRRDRMGVQFPRLRVWDRDYLATLIYKFPQLGYKYFSDESRSLAKYRKGPDDLYKENVALTERLGLTIDELESERTLRVRAERDAVWKDISFSAAHKIGNPIFAIETDLDPLQLRIVNGRIPEALEVIQNIRAATEKAKSFVEQFKSLARAQKVQIQPTKLKPILDIIQSRLKTMNVSCSVVCEPDEIALFDADRIVEVFDELITNSLCWLISNDKRVGIAVAVPPRTDLPAFVDKATSYVLILFSDNGPGVQTELKDRIFDAFYTTHDHGTGLGLALVRKIIEAHQGFIRECGLPGKGASFEIYLPKFVVRELANTESEPSKPVVLHN